MPAVVPVLSGVQERLAPLKAWLFPSRVLLQLDDWAITALALDGKRVLWCERVPLPPGLCDQGEPIHRDSLGDLLGDLLVERGFAGARVEAVLPATACQCRLVRWPEGCWPEAPQRLLARHEATLQLRGALSSLDLQLMPLALAQPTSLALAVSSQLLERWIAVFSQAGLSLVRMEAAQLCLCRALGSWPSAPGRGSVIALLQMDALACSLLIVEQGVPCYERNLPGLEQGADLEQALQRTLQFWRQQRPGGDAPLLLCHGSAVPERERLNALAAALELTVQVLDPLAEGCLQAAPPHEGPPWPPGSALLSLWGLLAAEAVGS